MQQKNTAVFLAILVIGVCIAVGYFSKTLLSATAATTTLPDTSLSASGLSNTTMALPSPSPARVLNTATVSVDKPPQTATLQKPVTNTPTSSPTASPTHLPSVEENHLEESLPFTTTPSVVNPPTEPTTATLALPATPIPDVDSSIKRAPMPITLTIPALAVNAPIVSVGLDANGFMDVPRRANLAGWYNLGPRPGEPSNAIIAGHVDWMGENGIFSQLHTLQPGDIIEVQSQSDFSFQYAVKSIQAYQNETAPVAEIFGGTLEPIITLITCTGPYNTSTAEYRDRLVVRATMITE